jgi:seryl-tRNA synthetase
MSTQVSDLYKKHHEVSDDIKSIQESIKDLAEELDKAKAENKGLQSEIILLVKQIASLEKIVNILNLAQKLKDQKDDQDAKADVKSGPAVSVPPPMPYATPKPVPAGTSYVTGTVAPGIGVAYGIGGGADTAGPLLTSYFAS